MANPAAFELAQALIPAIGRSCDTTDWTSDTIGAAIGAALGWVALRTARVAAASSKSMDAEEDRPAATPSSEQ